MKRLLIAATLALGVLAGAQTRVKAECGFGVGVGVKFTFSAFSSKKCGAPCDASCGYPVPYPGYGGPTGGYPGLPAVAYPGQDYAGYGACPPGGPFGGYYPPYPAFGYGAYAGYAGATPYGQAIPAAAEYNGGRPTSSAISAAAE